MNEWTTRKYWGNRKEVTVGYYCHWKDMGVGSTVRKKMNKEVESLYGNCQAEVLEIGEYEGEVVYFVYYFKYVPLSER